VKIIIINNYFEEKQIPFDLINCKEPTKSKSLYLKEIKNF